MVLFILHMREKFDQMATQVQTNLEEARRKQKTWYDHNAQEQTFQPGDEVLILLPTSASKLCARWQGPYEVINMVGRVNCLVRLHDRKKRD